MIKFKTLWIKAAMNYRMTGYVKCLCICPQQTFTNYDYLPNYLNFTLKKKNPSLDPQIDPAKYENKTKIELPTSLTMGFRLSNSMSWQLRFLTFYGGSEFDTKEAGTISFSSCNL
jgi:hypothetical protein